MSLAFFSSGATFWKARFEPSIDASKADHRTLVCYKETHSRIDDQGEYRAGTKIDPSTEKWTGTFRDAAPFNPEGADPENSVAGVLSTVRGWRHDILQVPKAYSRHRFWRNTSVARLKPGEVALLEGTALGPQWDEDIDNGSRPPGLQHLSSTTVHNVPRLQDFGSVSDGATATHHLCLYRALSGALVFGAGTAHWSWGLDRRHNNIEGNPYHDETIRIGVDPRAPDIRVQQATVNLLAEMGAQPRSLQRGLVRAHKSTDVSAPTSKVISPADGLVVPGGVVAISGTAADESGIVAGVEVSIDGGESWHPALGTESWAYQWRVPLTFERATIMCRAVDDSGNLECPTGGVRIRRDN